MSIYDLPNATTPDAGLIQLFTQVPSIPIMLLVFVWFTVLIYGTRKQTERTGNSDTPQWAVLASLTIFMLALIMTITTGFISLQTLVIVVSITVLTAIWFFMSRGRYE